MEVLLMPMLLLLLSPQQSAVKNLRETFSHKNNVLKGSFSRKYNHQYCIAWLLWVRRDEKALREGLNANPVVIVRRVGVRSCCLYHNRPNVCIIQRIVSLNVVLDSLTTPVLLSFYPFFSFFIISRSISFAVCRDKGTPFRGSFFLLLPAYNALSGVPFTVAGATCGLTGRFDHSNLPFTALSLSFSCFSCPHDDSWFLILDCLFFLLSFHSSLLHHTPLLHLIRNWIVRYVSATQCNLSFKRLTSKHDFQVELLEYYEQIDSLFIWVRESVAPPVLLVLLSFFSF